MNGEQKTGQAAERSKQQPADWNSELDSLGGYLRTRNLAAHEIVILLASAVGIVIWSNAESEGEAFNTLVDAVNVARQTMDEFEASGTSKGQTIH